MLKLNKKERLKYIGFNDLKFMWIGIPLVSLFVPVAFFIHDFSTLTWSSFSYMFVESSINVIVYWLGFRAFICYIRRRFLGFQYTRKRIMYQVFFILLYGWVMGIFLKFFIKDLCNFPYDAGPIKGMIATYFVSLFVMTIYEGVYLYYQNKRNILQGESLKREKITSELQALKDQINPHFLFNSLNTLSNIIDEDKKLATSFLKNMSDVFRYILEKRDTQQIALREELEFIDSYVFLQKERFRGNLNVDINVGESYMDNAIVSFSLQLLFENAIKHNTISSKYPLTIQVFIDADQYLVVKNNIRLKQQSIPSTGVGLANIVQRLDYFTDKPVVINNEDGVFIVKMPLLPKIR